MKEAKEKNIGQQWTNFEEILNRNNTKRAYQIVKQLTASKQGKVTAIQDKSGKCLTEEQDILQHRTEYCRELYNRKVSGDSALLNC